MGPDNHRTKAAPLRPKKSRDFRSGRPDELDTFKSLNILPENAAPAPHGSAPTSENRRKKNENKKKTTKDYNIKQASSETTKYQDDIEDTEKKSVIRRHDGGVTTVHRRRRASSSSDSDRLVAQENIMILEQLYSELTKYQNDIENAKIKSAIRRHDDGVTTVHRRRRASSSNSDGSAAQKNIIALEQSREKSLLIDIANDLWGWIHTMIKTGPKSLRSLYPAIKWVLVSYFVLLSITYLLVSMHGFAKAKMDPICSNRWVGPLVPVPFCESFDLSGRSINVAKIATSQEELAVVMKHGKQNFDIAKDMVTYGFALRDLNIRMEASNLSHTREIIRELKSLNLHLRHTARGISRFTAGVRGLGDRVKNFDEFAVQALEGIAERQRAERQRTERQRTERQRNPPRLPVRVLSAIRQIAAFGPAKADKTEEQIKRYFNSSTTFMKDTASLLIHDSFNIDRNISIALKTLDRINALAVDEVGQVSRTDVLGALWARMARPDDWEMFQSHTAHLKYLAELFTRSSYVIKQTTAALIHLEPELKEFRDDFASPGLILKDIPFETIIPVLKKYGRRLEEAERSRLRDAEEDRRRMRNHDFRKVVTTETVSTITLSPITLSTRATRA